MEKEEFKALRKESKIAAKKEAKKEIEKINTVYDNKTYLGTKKEKSSAHKVDDRDKKKKIKTAHSNALKKSNKALLKREDISKLEKDFTPNLRAEEFNRKVTDTSREVDKQPTKLKPRYIHTNTTSGQFYKQAISEKRKKDFNDKVQEPKQVAEKKDLSVNKREEIKRLQQKFKENKKDVSRDRNIERNR